MMQELLRHLQYCLHHLQSNLSNQFEFIMELVALSKNVECQRDSRAKKHTPAKATC